ncbi:glycosyltransferase family 2 protein [Argonema antarcticum]|uniref:glycosyltransferase family 2 protein n=1 Tax=Argonema antarcticum TaxID=2942763 RepID=UPI002011A259|nr:glycosyltransferase [Argonema antarcticum]MCL1470529.1 glycosyltransferase [Argonema antarcticum A004/B2]
MEKSLNLLNKPILSLCMIVKNEKENLPRCLASAKPYVDEMIVVDTGSQDGTPEIALSYGAKVSYFEWCDDFSAARNYSISLASGDWILLLDADEELVVETENFKQQLADNKELLGYALVREDLNVTNIIGGFHGRLFRNLPNLRYVNRFHEQLKYQDKNLVYGKLEGIKIIHYGNFEEEKVIKKAANRDIPILEDMRKKEDLSLWLLDCLARKYTRIGDREKAEECYVEVLDKLSPNLMDGDPPEDFFWVPTLLHILGVQLLEQKDYETARLICQRGLEWCPNYPPINNLAGEIVRALGFPLGAIAYFEKCLQLGQEGNYYIGEPFEESFLTTYPAYNIGCTYMEMQRLQEALAAFELALTFDANFTAAHQKTDEIKQILASAR